MTCFRCVAAAAVLSAAVAVVAQTAAQPERKPGAQPAAPAKPAVQPEKPAMPAPPPGMSEADMQACMEAAMPGAQHDLLLKGVGTWDGRIKMWMTPDTTEPVECTGVTVVSPVLDGRFVKCETTSEMPGFGSFQGIGFYGYDNVAGEFQCTWMDSCGTGMAIGAGKLSPDGKTMTWTCTYNCPITKKPATMRQVDRWTGDNTQTLEMYGVHPHTGKEFKMMEIKTTRRPAATPTEKAK